MSIKHILVGIPGANHAGHAPLCALNLAHQIGAHVTATDITGSPKDYMIPDVAMSGIGYAELYKNLETIQKDQRALARRFFDAAVATTKMPIVDTPPCSGASTTWVNNEGGEMSALGRTSDLIVMSSPAREGGLLEEQTFELALFTLRRPVLVLPTGPTVLRVDSAAIAWNGSIEAANAVQRTIAILEPGAKLTVIQIGDLPTGGVPAEGLMEYLGWHGFDPKLKCIPDQPRATAKVLLAEAKSAGARLLIMGAYSHSRMRELILGGVTKYMLTNTDLPLLLAH